MVCRHCGSRNEAGAKYCANCGQKLSKDDGISRKMMALAAVCLLIVGMGIGNLLPRLSGTSEGAEQQRSLMDILTKADAQIAQVLPVEDGSVAVLYRDGTVRVSGNSPFYGQVSGWSDVEKLYYNRKIALTETEIRDLPVLLALTKDGRTLSTDGSLIGWSNVKELHFAWQGTVGVTRDGRVLAEGDWEDPSFFTGMTDVEHLVYSSNQDIWGCLRKDGSVTLHGDNVDPNEVRWTNVRELRAADHSFYVIKNDGTVDGGVETDQSELNGAVKIIDFEDWLFGISADGRLLTHNGGNIYTNTGDMVVDVPGLPYYGEEIDIRQFDQVRDIVLFEGLILLNKDGTVQFLGAYPEWDFSGWHGIQSVFCIRDKEDIVRSIYGIREDGSVILNQYDGSIGYYAVTDQYRDWKLQALYGMAGGVVGLTTDGKLVGDGIYGNVDFSVFDR